MAWAVDNEDIDGDVEDGIYTNDNYGFSVRVPQAWQVAPEETRQAVEKTYPAAGGTRLFLLLVRAGTKPGELPDAITILGAKFGSPVGVSFNTAMVYLKAAGKTKNTKVLRPADAYWLGGTQVARQDVVTTSEAGDQYTAQMLLAVRDRLISFQVHSLTRERMEEDLTALAASVEFQPDWQARRNSHNSSEDGCAAGAASATSGAGAGCGTRGGGTSAIAPQRMKVSEAVLKGLLVSKVAPELPSGVEPEMIKAPVQMRVLVGVDGTVQKIWVFEGSAELAWNAVSAVRQWKFKPYAFEGQPVQVEGTLTIDFR
jgi:hypothetical protein